jgi:hypothetical protein
MKIYINDINVIERTDDDNGTTTVSLGDEIRVVASISGCGGISGPVANALTTGIIIEEDCNGSTGASITTAVYTVASGDIGTTLVLACQLKCASACI